MNGRKFLQTGYNTSVSFTAGLEPENTKSIGNIKLYWVCNMQGVETLKLVILQYFNTATISCFNYKINRRVVAQGVACHVNIVPKVLALGYQS